MCCRAREFVQLFSIGTIELEPDGRPKLNANGEWIPTYSNEHILSFARVWTGFDRQAKRSNIEDDPKVRNQVDPMQIMAAWKDVRLKPIGHEVK